MLQVWWTLMFATLGIPHYKDIPCQSLLPTSPTMAWSLTLDLLATARIYQPLFPAFRHQVYTYKLVPWDSPCKKGRKENKTSKEGDEVTQSQKLTISYPERHTLGSLILRAYIRVFIKIFASLLLYFPPPIKCPNLYKSTYQCTIS